MKKTWRIHSPDPSVVEHLCQELGIRKMYCEMLAIRGIATYKDAEDFFRPSLDQLPDPFLMQGMHEAVGLLNIILDSGEGILIYGDYDVDGTTATSLIFKALQKLSTNLTFAIPHREKDGYGLSRTGIEKALSEQCRLLITVDCGIRDMDAIAFAKEAGLQVIVVDHHEPGPELPPANAILNPKQRTCPYPYKHLSGCGIAFKLATACYMSRGLSVSDCEAFLDLVALSIAADMVPVTGENRILAYHGLKRMNSHPNPNFEQLLGRSVVERPVTLTDIAFQIAPKINAAGRMDTGEKAVSLFLSDSLERSVNLASQLMYDNAQRKLIEVQISEEATARILADPVRLAMNSIVVFDPKWHKGVLGIVAARLSERFHKPSVVLAGGNDILSGSVRSIPGLNVHQALMECQSLLVRFGGHEAAAGITIKRELLEAFVQAFEYAVTRNIHGTSPAPELWIETSLDLAHISGNMQKMIAQFEPFGIDNPQPVFLATGVRDNGSARILKDKHLRLQLLNDPHPPLDAIGFGLAEKSALVQSGQPFDICFCMEENYWNGERKIQLRILDIQEAGYPVQA